MKKTVITLFLLMICGVFAFATFNRKFEIPKAEKEKEVKVLEELEKINKELDDSYPDSPKGIIEINNQLLKYLYGKKMNEEELELYVDTVRRLYDKDLLELNTKEGQRTAIEAELIKNEENNYKLLDSKIPEVNRLENNEAVVKVVHYLNVQDISRVYRLTNESGVWKIISWENMKMNENKTETGKTDDNKAKE